eukprot:11831662-Ditylum_brightwellii.AAC.1
MSLPSHTTFHATHVNTITKTFDSGITAEITGPNYKEDVNALKLVNKHLPDIQSKRVEALMLLNFE